MLSSEKWLTKIYFHKFCKFIFHLLFKLILSQNLFLVHSVVIHSKEHVVHYKQSDCMSLLYIANFILKNKFILNIHRRDVLEFSIIKSLENDEDSFQKLDI